MKKRNFFQGWKTVNVSLKEQVQRNFLCCGFNKTFEVPDVTTTLSTQLMSSEPKCDDELKVIIYKNFI